MFTCRSRLRVAGGLVPLRLKSHRSPESQRIRKGLLLTRRASLWACFVWAILPTCGYGFGMEESSPSPLGTCEAAPSSPKTVQDYKRMLSEGDEAQKLQAIQGLRVIGAEAVPVVVDALDDPSDVVRAEAIRALANLAPAHAELAVPKLLELAQKDGAFVDEEWPNWILAFKALGRFGKDALPILEKEWQGSTPEKRAVLCVALSELGPAAAPAVPKLVELIEKDEPVNRRQAVGALVAIGPAAAPAVPVLRKALYHDDFHTQYWACRALGAIGEPALPAVPDLVDRLKNGVASVKRNAAAALGKLGPKIGPEAVEALIAAVDDPVQPVREQAVLALGRLGPEVAPQAKDAIEKSHAKRPIFPASAAHWAIWRLSGPLEPLSKSVIKDVEEGIYREEATEILRLMGPDAQPILVALEKALESYSSGPEDAEKRENVAQTLRELGRLPAGENE